MRTEFARLSDRELRDTASQANKLLCFMAVAAVAASRVLGQDPPGWAIFTGCWGFPWRTCSRG